MGKTLFEYTEGDAPLLTDYALNGQDPGGTPVMRRTTWQSILNLFGTAILNYVYGGWIPVTSTWTYVSATSYTVAGDMTSTLWVGQPIRYKQGGAYEYAYVLSFTYSSPNTTITISGGSSYALAAGAITDNQYGLHAHPAGFPQWFNLTAPAWTTTGTAFTNQPTNNYQRFHITGRELHVKGQATCHATSGGTGAFLATFTAGELPTYANNTFGAAGNATTVTMGGCLALTTSQNVLYMAASGGTALATNSEVFGYDITVEI